MRTAPHRRRTAVHRLTTIAAVSLAVALGGCSGDDESSTPTPTASSSDSSADPDAAPMHDIDADGYSEGLHDELIAMFERDQSGRRNGVDEEGDQVRTARLTEMIEQYGWPGYTLVGEDGEDASWVIAQHSDLDVDFQQDALALLTQAVAEGDASPGNLAYLTDRVAANLGEHQTYGTQMGCDGTKIVPNPPLAKPGEVDALRKDAGLGTLAHYYRVELKGACG